MISLAHIGMQSRSRVQSRNPSRAASPALSVRSRRSVMSSRQRQQKYMQQIDLTDDEDSDLDFTDDSRSRIKKSIEATKQTRQRRNTEQLDLDYRDNEVINRIQRMKEKSRHIRERRSGSLTNFPVTKKERDSGSLTPSDDELRKLSSKFRKSSLTSPIPQSKKKILSDSEREMAVNKKKNESAKVAETTSKVIKTESEESSDGEGHGTKIESPTEVIKEPQSKPKAISQTRPLSIAVEATKSVIKKSETQIVSGKNQQEPQPNTSRGTRQESTQSTSSSSALSRAEIPKETSAIKSSIQSTPTPPVNWECEHCTFVNESDAKICVICCKTRTEVLKQLPQVDEEIDINEINDSILQSESDVKQKGKLRKITFLPGTKAR